MFGSEKEVGTMIHPVKHLFDYHKYWLDKEARVKNPNFTPECGKLLDLKDKDPHKQANGLSFFTAQLRAYLPTSKLPLEHLQIYVMVVPSSVAGSWSGGLCQLADNLCRMNKNFVNHKQALRRHTTIDKLSNGGNRQMVVHLNSIELQQKLHREIAGKSILLLDDVTTTGNSLAACGTILTQYGASQIFPLALGRTHE